MKPLVSIFIDGLKPESIQWMPFLNSLPHKKRLETILGYSVTCHASMYTGVYPAKHGLWLLWQRSPETSPFRWLDQVPLKFLGDHIPGWRIAHKLTRQPKDLTAYWGIPRLYNLPLKYWPDIDVAEHKYWDEDEYLHGYPTIFEHLRRCKIPYDVVGMVPHVIDTSRIVAEHEFDEIRPWTYLFIGDVDALSHHYTQESTEVIKKLKDFDKIISTSCEAIQSKIGDYDLMVWSDHGHVHLNEKIDLYQVFRSAGDNLNNYLHLIDINLARFWFKNDSERKQVIQVLSRISNGRILTDDDLINEHVFVPDHRYGELVFYLDSGSAFSRTIFGFGLRQHSIHGYLPVHAGCDGVFLTNLELSDQIDKVRLVDLLPSHLSLFDIPIPSGLDGRVIWRQNGQVHQTN